MTGLTHKANVFPCYLALCVCYALFFCLVSSVAKANDELFIAVGLTKPPYVIQESNSGFEIELIQHTCQLMGKSCHFAYTEYGHSSKMLEVAGIDAVMTASTLMFKNNEQVSDTYISYQNVAISLKKNQYTIDTIEQLSQFSIATFQSANKVLGKDFAQAVKASPYYLQVATQSQQPSLLLKERVDVLVMDINIFKYLISNMAIEINESDFQYHPIFPISYYHMAFKLPENTQRFNRAWQKFQKSKQYQALKDRYMINAPLLPKT